MPLLPRLSSLYRNLFAKPRVEADLDAELCAYLEQLIDEKIQSGLTPADARRAALQDFGGVEQVKEHVRDNRMGHVFETLRQDLRYGLRTLAKSPAFTSIAILALALGIGANTAIFSVVYGILLRPLPYPDADRVAMVYMNFAPLNNERGTFSLSDYLDWKSMNHAFQEPSVYSNLQRFDLTGAGAPEQVFGASATAGFFSTLRVQPVLGRGFVSGEDGPGSTRVAVIGESLWQRRFAGSPAAIGQAINLNGVPCTIIGVMPAWFHFPRAESEVWTNLQVEPPTRLGPYFYRAFARLKPGVTLEQAQEETNAIGRRIEQQHPQSYSHLRLPVLTIRDALVGSVRPALLVMIGAVGLVLLIAVVNVANLTLSRATVRRREIALRLSLGAGRGRLVRQLLTESMLLAVAGGVAGVALAYAGIAFLRASNPGDLPRIGDVHLDGVALAFTLLISLLTGVLFGLAPALQSSRADLNATLKEGGRGGSPGAGRRRTRSMLVVSEIALSLMLLVGAGLLLRSLLRLSEVDSGIRTSPRQVLAIALSPASHKYADEQAGIELYSRLLQRVERLPGVESAAVSDSLPPDQGSDSDTFTLPGQPVRTDASYPIVSLGIVSSDYFHMLGVPLIQGRYFDEHDTPQSPKVAIISENLARRYFPNQNPLGKRIKQSGPTLTFLPWMEGQGGPALLDAFAQGILIGEVAPP